MKKNRSLVMLFTCVTALVYASQPAPGNLHAQTSSAGAARQAVPAATQSPQDTAKIARGMELHQAARAGDLNAIHSRLQEGADPNARDASGRTALLDAVSAGQTDAARALLDGGAKANITSSEGRTPLIEAATQGHLDIAQLLIKSGADLNVAQRGSGTALEAAERRGHNDVAALLRQAGARSSGRSVGDTVCVRPWKGDGYCGTVEAVNKTAFQIRVTRIVGCESGCSARPLCSAGRPVGGADGLAEGELVSTVSSCLTHTGVRP
jgi:hypothetical protein